ncbi:hypothetical protein DXG01_001348, partial [Tephrocybe rancida]
LSSSPHTTHFVLPSLSYTIPTTVSSGARPRSPTKSVEPTGVMTNIEDSVIERQRASGKVDEEVRVRPAWGRIQELIYCIGASYPALDPPHLTIDTVSARSSSDPVPQVLGEEQLAEPKCDD